MKRRWLPAVAAAALLGACHDDTTVPVSPTLTPGGPAFSISVSSSNFQQCANGSTGADPCFYINGVLNASKSAYHESDVIAERFVIPGLVAGRTYRLAFDYGWEKALNPGHMNYDFLAGWNTTLGTLANPCGDPLGNGSADIRGVCTATNGIKPNTTADAENIPDAVFTTNAPLGLQAELQAALTRFKSVRGANAVRFDILGGTLPNGSAFDNVTYTINGDDVTARFTVRFTATQSTAMLLWGGHFADDRDYRLAVWDDDKNPATPEHQGNLTGAAGQSGAPFQFTQQYIKDLTPGGDSTGIGSLSNNIQGSVLQAVPKGSIDLAPSGANPVGAAHTITATVIIDKDDGNGPLPASGVLVTFTKDAVSSTTGTFQNGVSTCTTDGTGKCSVAIISSTAGKMVVNASASVPVGTSTVNLTTVGGTSTNGPLTKVWADASIAIGPSAVNKVGDPHTFTVTVKSDKGDGTGLLPVSGVNPTVTFSQAPGTKTDNCATTGTGLDGKCTVVINSTTPGTFTANASVTLSVTTSQGNVSLTRSTSGTAGPGGSGPATKVYANAGITIAASAVNDVGTPHTFTVTVKADNGSGLVAVVGNKPTVTITPAPISKTDNCATTGTNASGECTVVINSTTANTFIASATATVAVTTAEGTKNISVTTDPDAGGTGNARKVYADGSIAIGPSATNSVGESHTFTVKVKGDAGNGSGLQGMPGVNPTVTISPVPSSKTDNCASAGTNTSGECTVVVSSAFAGTFTANASATFAVTTLQGPISLTRSTSANAGPGGSGAATKIFVAGTLKWLKKDGLGALLGGAVFTVCRTQNWDSQLNSGAGGYTDVTDVCFDVTDDVSGTNNTSAPPADRDGTAGKFELGGLILGKYTVKEKTAPAGYILDPDTENADLSTTTSSVTIATAFVNLNPTAFITIGPALDTNSTTEAHTFTATMTVDPKGGGTPVIDAIAITVAPTPSTLGTADCTAAQTGPDGAGLYKRSCTLTINSTTAGTFKANASGSATVGAITLLRSTDGNATIGNSGAATKVYVAPALEITKTAVTSSVKAGSQTPASYTVTVKNKGPGKAFGVRLNDQLLDATGFSWSVASSSGWNNTCLVDGSQHLDCGPVDLIKDATATVTVSSLVPASFVFQTPVPTPGQTKLEMDGNLVSDTGTDWANAGINCLSTPLVGCRLDPTGSTDDSFGQGTKEDTEVPTVTDGSIPPNKSDLLRFYIYNNRLTVGTAVHDFVYLAWERVLNPSGTTNMDFELNQSNVPSANGATPVRTAGDVLIKYDLSSGGTNLSMGFHTWVLSGACEASGAKPPCWGPLQSLAGAFEGRANDPSVAVNGSVVDPIAPNNPRTLSPLTFGEASIDMQLGGIFTAGQCTSFGSAYLKSRSSDSFTAAIKDFVKPVPISISNCVAQTISNTATATALNAGSVTSNPATPIAVNP